MKKILLFLSITLGLYSASYGQSVPQGMNYQAVARNMAGQVLANEAIELKIGLTSRQGTAPTTHYSETHSVTTNQFGLFTVVIGAGKATTGRFNQVPWSTDDIWMEIAIRHKADNRFATISNSKLLAVPYAFHAGTAQQLAGSSNARTPAPDAPFSATVVSYDCQTGALVFGSVGSDANGPAPEYGSPGVTVFTTNINQTIEEGIRRDQSTITISVRQGGIEGVPFVFNFRQFCQNGTGSNGNGNVWALKGNAGVNPATDRLGTTEAADLVFITTNVERMRLAADGNLSVLKGLNVKESLSVADSATIGRNLGVGNQLRVSGPTALNGQVRVDGITTLTNTTPSTSPATGALIIRGGTGLGGALNVGGRLVVNDATESGLPSTGAAVIVGGVGIGKTLSVGGVTTLSSQLTVRGVANLLSSLYVREATYLNSGLNVGGEASLLSTLSVRGATALNNSLSVDGATTLNNSLSVRGAATFGGDIRFGGRLLVSDVSDVSESYQTGAAVIAGGVGIGKDLRVLGASYLSGGLLTPSVFTRKITVDEGGMLVGGDVVVGGNFKVGQNTFLQNTLNVEYDNGGYLATFTNTNGDGGDGLQIKLGRTHPAWTGSDYLNVDDPLTQSLDRGLDRIKGYIYDGASFNPTDLLEFFPADLAAGSLAQLTNQLTEKLNDGLKLPLVLRKLEVPATTVVPRVTVFPGYSTSILGASIGIPSYQIGPYAIPAFEVFPETELIPRIPKINTDDLPSFNLPKLSKTSVTNSLTKQNEFISFVDKDNRSLGAIRAQSLNDFSKDYLDGLYLTNLVSSLIGLDILKDVLSIFSEFANLADAYNSLGVEYASGHGDYAEWLERADAGEVISAGDVVGVRGGKITKDLRDAEQIMAVSYRPIVLGNTPPAGQDHLGNKVAFMGQIPVKVLGAVSSGDYIVAKSSIPGYAVAISPATMTIDDYKLAVGRSWEGNAKPGPKMVNTLIGVHNGDFLKILKKNQQQVEQVEARLNTLEAKTDALLKTLAPTVTVK
ncbi:MAG: hypothetical protein JWP57_4223 [Spirosoma sp.]|nr:hypothetical protein [Spirosoma sp.]